MKKNITLKLYNMSNLKQVVLSIVIFIIFLAFVLPYISNYTETHTGSSQSPDTSLIYSVEDLYNIAETYGIDGRKSYVFIRFTFDLIWPIVYFYFLVTTVSYLLKKSNLVRLKYLIILPLSGLIFDYLENISSSIVMITYPIKINMIAYLVPYFTLLKWIFIGLSFINLIVLLIYYLILKLRIINK